MMHMKFSGVEIYYVIDPINSRLPSLDVQGSAANAVPGGLLPQKFHSTSEVVV